MRFKIIWPEDGYTMHRGGQDPRPTEGNNSYALGIRFVKDDVAVATLFQLPVGVVVDDVPE